MRLKRLLSLLSVCLILLPVLAMADTAGIANQVPCADIADASGTAPALMDDDPSTVWYGSVDLTADAPTWTIARWGGGTVREIWLRNGAQRSMRTYQAAGRVSQMDVTVTRGPSQRGQRVTYSYTLRDAYEAANDREWIDGYQRLLLPEAISDVESIELRVRGVYPGSTRQEVALSDILLSSGQPSPPSSGAVMLPSAPTVRPINPTIPPLDGDFGGTYPTVPPQESDSDSAVPTLPPGIPAKLLKQIGVRSGPRGGYDYVGSFFSAGVQVQVINKVWDAVNNLYWYQIDFTSRGVRYRGYCVQEYRVDLDPSKVPNQPSAISATILSTTPNYYGPGYDYKAHGDRVYATTKGKIYGRENGFVLFDWYDGRNDQYRRAWIPEANVTWAGK